MTSLINYIAVDETFPIAGVDNETQGFRENFSIIKNSLAAAKGEIEDLQSKVVLKAALSGSVLSNDMGGTTITNATLAEVKLKVQPPTVQSNVTGTLSFENGHYQIFELTSEAGFTFILDWPLPPSGTLLYGVIRVALYGNGTGKTVNFIATGNRIILKDNLFPSTLTVTSQTAPTIIEIWSADGTTFYLKYLGTFA
jgi:hypothetical protein